MTPIQEAFKDGMPKIYTMPAIEEPKAIQAYYDGSRFYLDNGRDFVPMDNRSIKSHLKRSGIADIDAEVCRIQVERYVKHIGPLAGKSRGVYVSNGNLLLASTSPHIIPSSPGTFPTIQSFMKNLLGGDIHETEQINTFLGWMHTARQAMLAGTRRPGQALVLAGPIACGKTQLINQLIVPSMGGRQAKPYKYLSGKTGFNADLLGAEVLVVDDEAASSRIENRRSLGEGIKSNIFASSVRIEGKFRDGFEFEPLWRIVFAVNDQPESLMVLPPLSADLSDKLIVLKCRKALEMSDVEFDLWQREIRLELPAFLHALEKYQIEPSKADGRCGVKSFYHPEIVAAISELSPEHQLRNLIDAMESSGGISLPWQGTAAALKGILTAQGSPVRMDSEKLLGSWVSACGVYLARLEGNGVEKLPMLNGDQRWLISLSGQVDTISN